MTFKRKLIAGIGAALVVMALISAFSYRSMQRSSEDINWVTHTHLVLEALADVRSSVVDAETNERGFIITGDESFMLLYQIALDKAKHRLADLRQLTADNYTQQHNLDKLDISIDKRFAVLKDAVRVRRQDGLDAAAQVVVAGAGPSAMAEIRTELGAMENEEQRLLADRKKAADASTAQAKFVLLAGNATSLLLLFLAGAAVYKEMARRREVEDEIRELNADLEKRVEERTQDLKRSNSELQQFAYVASHDLQEPLRMVASFTQLLAKRYGDKLGDDAREFIAFAVDGANRLQTLIGDLLTYSRVGTQAKPLVPVDCDKALDRVMNGLRLAMQESGTKINRQPLPMVVADEVQLCQLLQNLLTNAMKFHGSEPPHVDIFARRDGEMWRVFVRDNGIGIAKEHVDRIWTIFQRLHTKQEYPGTGIGLAICKKIAERHGGMIGVEPAPGGGSTFHFTVRAYDKPIEPEEREHDELRAAVATH